MTNVSEFRTRNLGLAAFLFHIGVEHIRTEQVGPKSTALIFADPMNECRKIETDYYSGAGCEDAQRFIEAFKEIKSTVHTALEMGGWRK